MIKSGVHKINTGRAWKGERVYSIVTGLQNDSQVAVNLAPYSPWILHLLIHSWAVNIAPDSNHSSWLDNDLLEEFGPDPSNYKEYKKN